MIIKEITHFHLFCGLGGGARGFNRGQARVGNMEAKYRCLGGIDVDPASIRDFDKLAGVRGTVMDLFSLEQYIAYHGKLPPSDWREATADDIKRAAGNERPNIIFLSAPCKGFSGLLAEKLSQTAKYQALNELTLRGMWLALEAWKDNPVELFVFENVPRIQNRGGHLLDQIEALLKSYGYAVRRTTHDCGELGGLAQSRKRFLLVARHIEKVPPFLYEPEKKRLRAVGDVLGKIPVPGNGIGGPMHRVPALQWKTWVRLAFVEAGADWRSLNKLRVEDGKLADYLIMPECYNGHMGVNRWEDPAGTVAACSRPGNGNFSVADPRVEKYQDDYCGVRNWCEPTKTIGGRSGPTNGGYSVADPRFKQSSQWNDGQAYGVKKREEPINTVTGKCNPGQGCYSVSDPRMSKDTSESRHKNVFRVVRYDEAAGTVSGGHGPSSGGQCVADPRGPEGAFTKFAISSWEGNTGTVIGGHGPSHGAYGVADPRPDWNRRGGNLSLINWDKHANTVIGGGKGVAGGQMAVADPRILHRKKGDSYLTGGHYGVLPWNDHALTISGHGKHDNGWNSVADPRMPEATDQIVAIIRALDGTWHRPFTTLELAALQSLVDPEEFLELDGLSDSAWRERIGNAVPSDAAAAIAGVMGITLLLAWSGQSFVLSNMPVWVQPVAIALSVDHGEIAL